MRWCCTICSTFWLSYPRDSRWCSSEKEHTAATACAASILSTLRNLARRSDDPHYMHIFIEVVAERNTISSRLQANSSFYIINTERPPETLVQQQKSFMHVLHKSFNIIYSIFKLLLHSTTNKWIKLEVTKKKIMKADIAGGEKYDWVLYIYKIENIPDKYIRS